MRSSIRQLVAANALGLVMMAPVAPVAAAGAKHEAQQQVDDAAEVIQQMTSDPKLVQQLEQAKGVFIVPDYGAGALVVGASGGQGVAVARIGEEWSGPVFYNTGSVSIGAQAGVAAGSVALLLMTDKAVANFRQDNKFSLDADAGLTIIDYSAKARASAGRGDVVIWTDTEGALAGADIGISDIQRDDSETKAFYGTSDVTAQDVFSGKIDADSARALDDALSGI